LTPDFDELVGSDLERRERERLRNVHELLVTAGPPAELPPHLEAGPTLAMTLAKPRKPVGRRIALLAAAIAVLALAFLGGYLAGNNGGSGIATGRTMQLDGTKAAPTALASLKILPEDASGNIPMTLTATGLPKLKQGWYYAVWLVRDGHRFRCGWFVSSGRDRGIDVTLNAPYDLHPGDTWIVAKESWKQVNGPVVLRPTT
jgi:hypothetical protein